jgi:N-acetylglutamate synthase-like GNAT family acetyltransferase
MEIKYLNATTGNINLILSFLKTEKGDTTNIDVRKFIIAKAGSKIIGCVRTKDLFVGCIELSSLVVSSLYRNKGIGSELVKRVLGMETRRPIYLLCMKPRENFYSNLGFVLIKKESLPEVLYKEYIRVSEKLADRKEDIISMAVFE